MLPQLECLHALIKPEPSRDPFSRRDCRLAGGYRIEGGKVVMCDSRVKPVQDSQGHRYKVTIAPGENAHALAAHLTRQIRRKVTGDNGFGRDLKYQDYGIA